MGRRLKIEVEDRAPLITPSQPIEVVWDDEPDHSTVILDVGVHRITIHDVGVVYLPLKALQADPKLRKTRQMP